MKDNSNILNDFEKNLFQTAKPKTRLRAHGLWFQTPMRSSGDKKIRTRLKGNRKSVAKLTERQKIEKEKKKKNGKFPSNYF